MVRRNGLLVGVLALVLIAGAAWAGSSASKAAKSELDRGYEAARRGYWNEAMARYRHGTELDPSNAEIWNNLAVSLEAVGEYDNAQEAYAKALELDPGNRRIRRNNQQFQEFYSTYIAKEDDESADEKDAEAGEGKGEKRGRKPVTPPARDEKGKGGSDA